MPVEKVVTAINSLDLKQLSLENVELLQRMVPTEQETKAYREFVVEKKNVNLLTEEDKFLMQLTKVERISAKLSIMNYIGNFVDNLHLITPVRYPSFNLISCFINCYFILASTCCDICLEFCEEFKKITICPRNYFSFWKLFK